MKQLLLLVIIAAILPQCHRIGDVSSPGGGDDVTTATVFNPDGSFASQCSVILVPANTVPGVDTIRQFETITDSLGQYSFIALPPDTYNIYVKKDDLVSYTSSVVVGTTGGEKVLPDNTLGPSGGIDGVVRLSGAADNRTILIMMIGGTFTTWPEGSSGRFSISGLAEGTYNIRFYPTDSLYRILDTSFTVAAGEDLDVGIIELTHAGDTITDPDTVVDHDTVVVGDSPAEGVWGPDRTYSIMNEIRIQAGRRLEIREGTRIVFMGQYDFRIEGNCIARGTVNKPVIFTYGLDFTGRGWNYLNCTGPTTESDLQPLIDTVLFDNCILEKFHWLLAQADNPDFYFSMTNCIVRNTGGLEFITSGMSFNSGKGFYIRNNVFHTLGPVNSHPETANCSRPLWVQDGNSETWQCNDPHVQVINNIFYDVCWNNTSYHCYFPYCCYPALEMEIPEDPTCVYDDPLFEDIDSGNYRLQPDSPCNGTGGDGVNMGLIFTDDQ